MKKSKKLIVAAFTAAAIFLGSNLNAQTITPNKVRLGIGVEGGIPTGCRK